MELSGHGRRTWAVLLGLVALLLLVGAAGADEAPETQPADDPDMATGQAVPAGVAAVASGGPPIVWTELGPAGLIARAVTTEPACPALRLDGQPEDMQERAGPTSPDFPIRVCEAAVPAQTRVARIGRQRLPLFRADPRRIVVIGDAGCRISATRVQACNDPGQWPFAEIARRAAYFEPDLVIHVGDYIYRETPCPPGNQGCAGSPHGDNWASLEADLFTPARPLLRAAPWVFARGNHETCARGGEAWFRLLDPRPRPPACADYTEPYRIPLGAVDLLVLDSAIADDFAEPPDQVAAFRQQFDLLRQLATDDSWLLSHKPLYVFGHAGEQNGVEQLFIDQLVLQEASANDFPPTVRLFLGGHVHLFENLSFGPGRPPQLVVGNSGTELDPPVTTPLPGLEIAGMKVAHGLNLAEFGFVVLERHHRRWTATLRGVDGTPLVRCALGQTSLTCEPADP